MRLDYYLPEYDYVEKHRITIHASPEKVFEALWSLDMSKSKVIRILFLLRNTCAFWNRGKRKEDQFGLGFSIKKLIKAGFIPLEEVRNQEIIMGLIGRFWQPAGGVVQNLNTSGFMHFSQTGYCKVAWNFCIVQNTDSSVTLSTETRILCLGRRAKYLFLLYWIVIRPFSEWTRLEMLRIIKQQAERKAT